MKKVEREGFFDSNRDFKLIKICVRKPKGKKNLTDLFRIQNNG